MRPRILRAAVRAREGESYAVGRGVRKAQRRHKELSGGGGRKQRPPRRARARLSLPALTVGIVDPAHAGRDVEDGSVQRDGRQPALSRLVVVHAFAFCTKAKAVS